MSDIDISQHAENVLGSVYQYGYVEGDVNITIHEALKLLPAGIAPPDILFGRDALLRATLAALANGGGAVLLCGVGGMGKTAAAATIAARWLAEHSSAVLWVTAGRGADLPAILNGIAASFGSQAAGAMAAAVRPDDKLNVARSLLGQAGLFVLDDMWDANALAALLDRGLPPGLPMLLTGRTVFGRIAADRRFDVARLDRPAALALLSHHAAQDFAGEADELCATLGDHPYALVIAGAWLARPAMTLDRLRRKLAGAPQDLAVPGEFGALPERQSVAALLRASVDDLPPAARRAFQALGTLFAPRATPELLALVLQSGEDSPAADDNPVGARHASPLQPEDDAPDLAAIMAALEGVDLEDFEAVIGVLDAVGISLEQLMAAIEDEEEEEAPGPSQEEIDAAAEALDVLAARLLCRSTPAERYCAPFYALHDLTYAFAHALADSPLSILMERGEGGEVRAGDGGAVRACVAYARRHAHKPYDAQGRADLAHHNALQAELPNLLGAAHRAAAQGMPEAVNQLGWDLYGNSVFLDTRGRAAEALALLPLAAARALALRRDEGAHLTHLGLAYADLGRYQDAIAQYERALEIDRAIGDRRGEGNALGNLGNAYYSLGEYNRAIAFYEQALVISREIGDRRGEGNALGNLGLAYYSLGEYRRAIAFYEQCLAIAREIGDRRGEGADLGNLGIAYADLGEYRRAIEYHEQYLAIARAIGDRQGEANTLNNIGNVHFAEGDYTQAVAFYEQGRTLYAAMGMGHRVEQVEGNIARARAALQGGAS